MKLTVLFGVFERNGNVPTGLHDAYFDLDASGAVNLSGDLFGVVERNGDALPARAPVALRRPASIGGGDSQSSIVATDAFFASLEAGGDDDALLVSVAGGP